MGGRGSSSATGKAVSGNAELKRFLIEGSERYMSSGSVRNRELGADALAMAGMIGTDRMGALLASPSFKQVRESMGTISSGKVDEMLQGRQRPLGMDSRSFSEVQSSLRSLKSQGYSNEEIAGAVRWGRHVRR